MTPKTEISPPSFGISDSVSAHVRPDNTECATAPLADNISTKLEMLTLQLVIHEVFANKHISDISGIFVQN